MESRGPEDSKNVKTSQAYFFEWFISFFEDFSLTKMQVRVYLDTVRFLTIVALEINDMYTKKHIYMLRLVCKRCYLPHSTYYHQWFT